MKKTLMIALAGMMLFAFTQCGGNGKETGTETTNENAVEETSNVKGSKQFTEMKSAYDELGKTIKNITTCDELDEVAMALVLSEIAISLGGDQYAAEDKMTEKEQAKLKEITEKLLKDLEKKGDELGCEKKEYSL